MRAWIDGRLLTEPTAPALSVLDHGVTVGDGVFESVKIEGGKPFALTPHLERLRRSARGLGLEPVDDEFVRAGVEEVLAGEPIGFGRLRITLTGGEAPPGSGRGDSGTTLIVVASEAERPAESTAAITVEWTRNERGALAGLKTTSYAENVLALAAAQRRGATEAVFANTQGMVCEGTGSNVFYVIDGELRTPTLASGCLAGITRALVLEWVGAVEVNEPLELLEQRASEIFLVSTMRDVQGVTRWNDRELPLGPVTAAAQRTWRAREAELLGL